MIQTPGFKLQIGSTNIMSLQHKIIATAPVNQQQQHAPPAIALIQPSPLTAELKRLSTSIKKLKPIAPIPVIANYTSTVIKPAPESNVQSSSPGASSVCHHVLPFGTTIKVTAGNEPNQGPIVTQQLQQQQQPQQLLQQPQSSQGPTLIKQIQPVSPASVVPPQASTFSPNQNKMIINKIFYKAPEVGAPGPSTTTVQPRIIPATPPLSPVSLPELKRKIIITGPSHSGSRKRLPSPLQRTAPNQPAPAQVQIVQSASTVPVPAPKVTVENILSTVTAQADFYNPSSHDELSAVAQTAEEITVSFVEMSKQDESSEADEEVKPESHCSSQVDGSEAEVSSTTTERIVDGASREDYEDDIEQIDALEIDTLEGSQDFNRSPTTNSSEKPNDVEEEEEEDNSSCNSIQEENSVDEIGGKRPKTSSKEQRELLQELWNEQMKSPRLQKRANSDIQRVKSSARAARRLSEPVNQEEQQKEEEDVPPMPKPLAVKKRTSRSSLNRKSGSTKTIHSLLLCNEKFEMESDESRSVKTSASSLHTISPPKKEESSSGSPPAYDQDKLQEAIDMYKKTQVVTKAQSNREKRRSGESRSIVDREEKDEKEFIDADYGSTPSDLIKWDDGIGYIRSSYLHFQFNQFGLVEPMESKEYLNHVKTNVYDSLKEPISARASGKPARNKRKMLASESSYRCRGCRGRGNANDFATPDYCSVACMKQTKNESLLTSIARSKTLQKKGIGSSESEVSNNTPLPTSDDDSLGSSLNFTNAFKEKSIFPKKESASKAVVDTPAVVSSEQPNQPKFVWETYLAKTQGTPSPLNLFVNPYPSGTNKFRSGMKLEAIDPENNSLFCVCTIVEVRGFRMKLNLDGYSHDYDFWVNADSLDIFPPGWCQKTGRILQPPKEYEGEFRWIEYLTKTHSMAASRYLFTHLNSTSTANKFEIGMSLEADDLKKSGKVCVASVTDKIDNRILVHFDGWDERYDYWVDIHSPYIHHINWHHDNGYGITPPPDWGAGDFDWTKYMRQKSRTVGKPIISADKTLFVTRHPKEFVPGMKLEVVDRKNQMLIRPATVVATDGYEIKVCFDGWPNFYSFWIEDDSSDIHPMNWCKRTNHPIEFPPDHRPPSMKGSCEIPYCLGQGNAKFLSNRTHMKLAECPYRTNNWLMEDRKRLRIDHSQIITSNESSAQKDTSQPDVPPVKKIKREPEDQQLPATSPQTTTASPNQATLTQTAASKPNSSNNNNGLDQLIRIALPVISDFGPRLQQSYRLWKSSSRILDRCAEGLSEYDKNPLRWSVEDVASYVERFPGCSLVGNQIRDEQINGTAFLSLTQEDLVKYLDVKLGPAIKLYNRIINLRLEVEKHFVKF
ncbi:lethal(3)malignant brain tumor-like protein 3 isoform X2 [Toxorhynchites rutilus septentrionalis]|uniref:lethal(3)malignant brain tumor-like protein 3 isoform X2 n=1 Tax=Toxorhynchites rutilus septentrionalis TaxID=329112 RepID=UPI00247A28A6|nr:lethal(3)malignant brain tumor-like protein 3 isoform X2 [Toxorhynchites rutilus septentrionalis]